MKKQKGLIFLMVTAMLLLGSSVFATPIMFDVSAAGYPGFPIGDADALTGTFNQIGFDSQTSTIQYDDDGTAGLSVGDTFSDSGNLNVNGLLASTAVDDEGLGFSSGGVTGYEITGYWEGVTGEVTGVSYDTTTFDTQIDTQYNTGSLDFYLDTTMDATFANLGLSDPPSGAGGTGFNNGVLIATLQITGGVGHTFVDFTGDPVNSGGNVDLALQFSYMLPGFRLNAAGVDLLTLSDGLPEFWVALSDMNIDTPNNVPGIPTGALYTAYSNQNGSMLVPEPCTTLLLGLGLFGLGIAGYRRKKS